jgi:hypothetical protein
MAQKKPAKLSSGEVWEKLEFYPTPPWATRALFEHVLPRVSAAQEIKAAWDPCAGYGHMVEVLREYCSVVEGSDVYNYPGAPQYIRQADFLDRETVWPFDQPGWIISNPPFVPAVDMLEKALALDGVEGVALLLRLQWLTTEGRYTRIFGKTPPLLVAPFAERPAMCLGGYDVKGSTATDYAWLIWARDDAGWRDCTSISPGGWYGFTIPLCRDALFRESDLLLAQRHVPGWVPPSQLKKLSPDQGRLTLPAASSG